MKSTTTLIFALVCLSASAQQFQNGDLEGTPTTEASVLPAYWSAIPNTNPICHANHSMSATPDMASTIGPVSWTMWGNVYMTGNPQSGATFVTGLDYDAETSDLIFHEGIEQTVTGLTPGEVYTLRFYQTIVKQNEALDQSGGWSVYLDNLYLTTSTSTFSTEPPSSLDLLWELRTVAFTASSFTHTFGFLPKDDDNTPDVRMAIDNIYLYQGDVAGISENAVEIELIAFPCPATDAVTVHSSLPLNTTKVEITNLNGQTITANWTVENAHSITVRLDDLAAGLYSLTLWQSDGTPVYKQISKL